MSARATNLAIVVLLLLAACGDGDERSEREDRGGSEPSSAELQQIELALDRLDARISRLEVVTEELLGTLGDDAGLLRELPALIEELRIQRELLGAAAEELRGASGGDGEDPCGSDDLEDCAEATPLVPAAE